MDKLKPSTWWTEKPRATGFKRAGRLQDFCGRECAELGEILEPYFNAG
jgi:hypothetical protein